MDITSDRLRELISAFQGRDELQKSLNRQLNVALAREYGYADPESYRYAQQAPVHPATERYVAENPVQLEKPATPSEVNYKPSYEQPTRYAALGKAPSAIPADMQTQLYAAAEKQREIERQQEIARQQAAARQYSTQKYWTDDSGDIPAPSVSRMAYNGGGEEYDMTDTMTGGTEDSDRAAFNGDGSEYDMTDMMSKTPVSAQASGKPGTHGVANAGTPNAGDKESGGPVDNAKKIDAYIKMLQTNPESMTDEQLREAYELGQALPFGGENNRKKIILVSANETLWQRKSMAESNAEMKRRKENDEKAKLAKENANNNRPKGTDATWGRY